MAEHADALDKQKQEEMKRKVKQEAAVRSEQLQLMIQKRNDEIRVEREMGRAMRQKQEEEML